MSQLQRTPLFSRHRAAGARMVDFAGWEMPVQYSSLIEEHRAVRNHAGLFDVSHMGEIRFQGPQAEEFLQYLTPNDVSKLTPGRAHYSALLHEDGTYQDDLLVYRLAEDDFLTVVNASNASADHAWAKKHADGYDVDVIDASSEWALMALQGPASVTILTEMLGPSVGEIRYYRFARGEMEGEPALLSRTGYTGEDGFEIYLAPDAAGPVWDRLLEVGESHGLLPAGLGARDTLRLEAAMALYGHEIDSETTPWEAGLDWTIKLDKGDFIGRDALVASKKKGVERRLVGFEIRGRGIARQGHAVHYGEREVGEVTSGTWSPTLERALGMAYVKPEVSPVGTELRVEVRGKELPAQVVRVPFYQRPR